MAEDAPDMQLALAQLHATAERPRCLCVRGGVEMYIAAIGQAERWVLKRMPGRGAAGIRVKFRKIGCNLLILHRIYIRVAATSLWFMSNHLTGQSVT